MKKALIEKTFPLRDVSEESAREKNIRSGHISTLHTWWARRPLASSRATIYASLVGAGDELEEIKRREFIKKLCKWENTNDLNTISRARKDILHEHGHPPPGSLTHLVEAAAYPLRPSALDARHTAWTTTQWLS